MHKILYRKDRDMYGFEVSHPGGKRKLYFRWKKKEEAVKGLGEPSNPPAR